MYDDKLPIIETEARSGSEWPVADTAVLEALNEQLRKEIAECEQAQKTTQAEQDFVNTVLESLSHPFYIIDAHDYTIKKANPAAIAAGIGEHSTCYSISHRRTHPCEGLDHPCPLEEVKKTGRPAVVEHLHYDSEGNAKNVDVYAYPVFDSEGAVKQVIEYCLDVTDRKRAERLVLRSERLKAIAELASGVAHNFNNLLQIVLGSAQLALTDLEAGDLSRARKHLARIVDSSQMGSQTVKRLQDFARIRSSNGAETGKVFDISRTCTRRNSNEPALVANRAGKGRDQDIADFRPTKWLPGSRTGG